MKSVVMTTGGMWNWYSKQRQGYTPVDTRITVDCSLSNSVSSGSLANSTHCGYSGNHTGGASHQGGWVSPGSRRHFHQQQRYGGYGPVPTGDSGAWGRANGCSPAAAAPVSRALTPPPTWGQSLHHPPQPHPAAHRTSTTTAPQHPTSWGSASQVCNGSADWSSGHSSGDCLLGAFPRVIVTAFL